VIAVEATGVIVVVAVLLAATVFAAVRRRTDGRVRDVAEPEAADALTADLLGHPLGSRATLVQFSTSFCQPCRATRTILNEVAEMVDGVEHVEIDAESRLDLVRQLDVMRTPTVFVLDAKGAVVKRAVGQPRKADVVAALGVAIS
jgi:thiol-disulfide isomerase/thioredoxin